MRPPPPRAALPVVLAALPFLTWGCGSDAADDPPPRDGGCDTGACGDGSPEVDAGPGAPDGDPCAEDAACEGGICLFDEDGAGVCGRRCGASEDCPAGSVCGPSPDRPAGGGPATGLAAVCKPGGPDDDLGGVCGSDRECDAEVCLGGQCSVVCADDEDCLPGQTCAEVRPEADLDATVPLCTYAPVDAPTVERVPLFVGDLVAFDPQPLRGLGVAPDAVSVTFVAERRTPLDATLVFARVVSPAGSTVLAYPQILAFRDQPLRWIASPLVEVAALVVPNTTVDRVNFTGGRWAVENVLLGANGEDGDAEVALWAEVKRAPDGVIEEGSVDLDVYLVGVDVTAAEALDSPVLAGGLERSRSLFDAAGITLDTVRFHDVAPEDAERLAIIESFGGVDSELAELFRLGAGGTERSIDVFLVRSLENPDTSMTLGIAGDIPGPPLHGTSTSGVAVAFDVSGDADAFGKVLTHELGHYLGLYHVRERLDACPPNSGPTEEEPCAPFGGGDVLTDTTQEVVGMCPPPCDDARQFVMYWSLQRRADRSIVLSDGQAYVLRRHPLVQ